MPTTPAEPAVAPSEQPAAPVEKAALDKSLSGTKRKETEKPKRTFKAVAQMALAMRKFANSLNPTYTYGKQTTSSGTGGHKHVTDDKEVASSGRPSSPGSHPHYAYEDRGHKFDFLLKPLPPTEDEEA